MKKHTFPITVTCILLVSVLLLAGCMHAVMDDKGTSKEYTTETISQTPSDVIIDGDIPTAQSEMQKKFNVYLHETDGGVRIFSGEQYDELKAVRDRGERIPLTYDEVLYLISDTINLYFKYDKIILTNPRMLDAEDILPRNSVATIDDLDMVFETYRGNYSEFFDTAEQNRKHAEITEALSLIIFYRLYIHDAGFSRVRSFIDGEGKTTYFDMDFMDIYVPGHYVLLLDGGTDSGESYNTKLQTEVGKTVARGIIPFTTTTDFDISAVQDTEVVPLDAVLLYYTVGSNGLIALEPQTHKKQLIFPTPELNARKPETELTLTAAVPSEDGTRQTLFLNRKTSQFVITKRASDSVGITGKFFELDRFLYLYSDNLDGETARYTFFLEDEDCNTYIYNKSVSSPHPKFDFPDSTAFCTDYKEYLKKEMCQDESGVLYHAGFRRLRSGSSALTYYEIDYNDGTSESASIDRFDPTFTFESPELHVLTAQQGDVIRAEHPEEYTIHSITVYTKNATYSYTASLTSWKELSEMPAGEYYIEVHVKIRTEQYGCNARLAYRDLFQLNIE